MEKFDTNQKAVGIILLEKYKDIIKIYPIIWVKAIDTLYYETACGSGSLATLIYKNYIDSVEKLEVLQPSGDVIKVELNKIKNIIQNATISGKVIEEEKYEFKRNITRISKI